VQHFVSIIQQVIVFSWASKKKKKKKKNEFYHGRINELAQKITREFKSEDPLKNISFFVSERRRRRMKSREGRGEVEKAKRCATSREVFFFFSFDFATISNQNKTGNSTIYTLVQGNGK
jgi:hypothetical protein